MEGDLNITLTVPFKVIQRFANFYDYTKYKGVNAVKSKAKALRHFKVDSVLKVDATLLSTEL